ncbi:MAG TPA: histidinol-phosphate transaminase [Verrucomicrobiae bacterium]
MRRLEIEQLIRPLVRKLEPYVPGEQPRIKGLIKLNTNENPYPPAPAVLAATRAAVDPRLRLYPNPTSAALRERLAKLHCCQPENIIVGNGSDELLAMAVRAFVEPGHPHTTGRFRHVVQYFDPSYSLYPVLAEIHGSVTNGTLLNPDFTIPSLRELRYGRSHVFDAALTFVTTPNAPSGRSYPLAQLDELCRAHTGVVVLDEAYVDFASENAMALALKYPHVLVARTFSKAYSLCFQRVGYFMGNAELIGALHKIRDSYNVNGLGQVAALATLDELPYYRAGFKRVIATRERVSRELEALDFRVIPSQTNFILVEPPKFAAKAWLGKLRDRKILVRWFSLPAVEKYLRITIGTEAEMDQFLKETRSILKK